MTHICHIYSPLSSFPEGADTTLECWHQLMHHEGFDHCAGSARWQNLEIPLGSATFEPVGAKQR